MTEDKFEDKVQALSRELCRRIDVEERFWRQYAGQIRERLIADAVAEVIATPNLPLLNESEA